jgi:hypothetical protein
MYFVLPDNGFTLKPKHAARNKLINKFFMKICGPEREERVSLERHIKSKFMVNAYQYSEILENTRGCSVGLENMECIQHFCWEKF